MMYTSKNDQIHVRMVHLKNNNINREQSFNTTSGGIVATTSIEENASTAITKTTLSIVQKGGSNFLDNNDESPYNSETNYGK